MKKWCKDRGLKRHVHIEGAYTGPEKFSQEVHPPKVTKKYTKKIMKGEYGPTIAPKRGRSGGIPKIQKRLCEESHWGRGGGGYQA